MTESASQAVPSEEVCKRILDARDARFDGVFFVGITTTRIYCRPVCPARVSYHSHRRFFESAASAERAGFRPCLRCRPELAPGRAIIDAVPRLARVAAQRIAAGALNGRTVDQLAHELGVGERHLRRALEREIGVSPVELALTHRLLLAKRLLADTNLSVTRIAFASGFQSLRRFNSVIRERYGLSPSEMRRAGRSEPRVPWSARIGALDQASDAVRLTLAYRAPLAWDVVVKQLTRGALPGIEVVHDGCYSRTVRIGNALGVISVRNAAAAPPRRKRTPATYLNVDVSASLLSMLMPLLARLRQTFDLDAEPTIIDAHLGESGLGEHVKRHPGLRILSALDGFEVVLRELLDGSSSAAGVLAALGERYDSPIPCLTRLAPTACCVAEAGTECLVALGLPQCRAEMVTSIARAVRDGSMHLEPGSDVAATRRALLAIDGVDERLATTILMRALHWPDAFPAAGDAPCAHSEKWRPWRSYALLHLGLEGEDAGS